MCITVISAYTPHPERLIAPGMSTRYTIKFSPDSLCDFQDQLKVLIHFTLNVYALFAITGLDSERRIYVYPTERISATSGAEL